MILYVGKSLKIALNVERIFLNSEIEHLQQFPILKQRTVKIFYIDIICLALIRIILSDINTCRICFKDTRYLQGFSVRAIFKTLFMFFKL